MQASGSLAGCVCQVKRTHTVTLYSLDLALECLHRGREPCSLSSCCSPGCPRVTGPGRDPLGREGLALHREGLALRREGALQTAAAWRAKGLLAGSPV